MKNPMKDPSHSSAPPIPQSLSQQLSSEQQQPKQATLFVAPNCGLEIKYDAYANNAEFGLEYKVLNLSDFPLSDYDHTDNNDNNTRRGWLSPMRDVTLPLDAKEQLGIPGNATKFSYVYPPIGLADEINWEKVSTWSRSHSTKSKHSSFTEKENKWALPYVASFGAYAYFDDEKNLLGVNAISLQQTPYEIHFKGPYIATKASYREINDLNRYQSLYLDVLGEIGFIGSACIDPGDNKFIDNTIPGQEQLRNDHGGFLYFRHDKSAVIFLIDGENALHTPSHGIGSLILDGLSFCKYQLRYSTLSTTCPSKFQVKDKIHRACEQGSKVALRHQLLQHEHSTSLSIRERLLHKDTFQWTPLHYACCYNAQDEKLIELLLDNCSDAIYEKNNNDLLPIHLACHNNPSLDVIKLLLKYDTKKETIKMKSKHHGLLPLHFACSNSSTNIEVIRYLLLSDGTNHPTLFSKGELGWTALHLAISGNHKNDVIQLLIQFITDSSSSPNHKQQGIVPLVREKIYGMLPIQLACLKGCSVNIISTLLEADKDGKTFHDIVDSCMEYDLRNSTILHIALENAPIEVIDLLLMKEVKKRCMPFREDIDLLKVQERCNGELPMHVAARRSDLNVETFRRLLRLNKHSVFAVDNDGNTPLHLLCMNANVNDELIQMFLDAADSNDRLQEKRIEKLKKKKFIQTMYNRDKHTPLYLAIQSRAFGAHALLSPQYICLKGLNQETKDKLLQLVIVDKAFQSNIVKNLAERQYFALIMLELFANICATVVYFNASNNLMASNTSIRPIETVTLISCITIFVIRELIQLKSSTLSEYVLDGWNWIECSSIFVLLAATYHMIELRGYDEMEREPKRVLFTWSGVLLLLQFIFIIRTTFLPFARFVAGLMAIFWTLVPFFVVSSMCLLAFTYSFLMSGGRDEECPDFGTCFLWTLEGFFFGMNDFMKTPMLDVTFGIIGVVVLLNVVIAIVSNAWDDSLEDTKEVFWQSRVEVLFQYRVFKKFIGKNSYFAFLFYYIDNVRIFLTQQEKGKKALWRIILCLMKDLFWFLFGFVTLGLGWPEAIRQKILSAGM